MRQEQTLQLIEASNQGKWRLIMMKTELSLKVLKVIRNSKFQNIRPIRLRTNLCMSFIRSSMVLKWIYGADNH